MEGGEGGPCKGDLQMLHNQIDKDEGVSQAASSGPHSRPNGDREVWPAQCWDFYQQ